MQPWVISDKPPEEYHLELDKKAKPSGNSFTPVHSFKSGNRMRIRRSVLKFCQPDKISISTCKFDDAECF